MTRLHQTRRAAALAVVSLLTWFSPSALAGLCVDHDVVAHAIDRFGLPTPPAGIAVAGSFAYVVDTLGGLRIIDISSPAAPAVVGYVYAPGEAKDVSVGGLHAYLASAGTGGGMDVIDVSNPASPSRVGRSSTPAFAVAVSGAFAYLAGGASGLVVVDVSDPAAPAPVGSLVLPGEAHRVAVLGSDAYVAVSDSTIYVVDVSAPQSPGILGQVPLPSAVRDLAVSGSRVYAACDRSGLLVIDVSDPVSPVVAGSLDLSRAASVEVAGAAVYVGEDAEPFLGAAVNIIDASDASNPVVTGTVGIPAGVQGEALSASRLWIAYGPTRPGIQGIDLAHPVWPVSGRATTPGSARDVAVSGSLAYVADDSGGLRILDVTDPAAPVVVGTLPTSGTAEKVAVSGSFAYVGVAPSGLAVVNVADPGTPELVGHTDLPAAVLAMAVSGSSVFCLLAPGDLYVVDAADPASPTVTAGHGSGGARYSGIGVSGPFVYLWGPSHGLATIDVSDPTSIVPDAWSDLGDLGGGFAVDGPYAYLATLSGRSLLVIDISNPPGPYSVAGSVLLPAGAVGVAVSGDDAYVGWGKGGLSVVDVSNLEAPAIVAETGTPEGGGVGAIDGSIMVVAAGAAGLAVEPAYCGGATPVRLASFEAVSRSEGILLTWSPAAESDAAGFHVDRSAGASGEFQRLTRELIRSGPVCRFFDREVLPGVTYLYRLTALDRSGGVEYFGPIPARAASGTPEGFRPLLGRAFPNPVLGGPATIPFTVGRTGRISILVQDLAGRRVRTLLDEVVEPGERSAVWDGRDDRGEPVPAGIYFYRLTTPGFAATRKLVTLK